VESRELLEHSLLEELRVRLFGLHPQDAILHPGKFQFLVPLRALGDYAEPYDFPTELSVHCLDPESLSKLLFRVQEILELRALLIVSLEEDRLERLGAANALHFLGSLVKVLVLSEDEDFVFKVNSLLLELVDLAYEFLSLANISLSGSLVFFVDLLGILLLTLPNGS